MSGPTISLQDAVSVIIDNRGRTCPITPSGIPLIATNCIKNDRLYPVHEKVRFVSPDVYNTWFRGHPRPGDYIFVTKGSPGRVCVAPEPVNFCIAQDMVALRANPAKIYPKYLFAALRSEAVQAEIENMHVGTLIPHFKKGDFDKLLIPLLDPAVQGFLGDMYFDLSAQIDLNHRTNETLEAIARALFKDWFVEFGPTRAKAESYPAYLSTDLWNIFPDALDDAGKPEGWKEGTLADVAELNPESWSTATYPDQIRYVDLSNTKWGTVESAEVHDKEGAPSRAQRILRPGDTIVGTVRPGNGSYAFIGEAGLTGSTGFAVLRPKNNLYREFTYLAATSSDNIQRLAHLADGGAYPAVRPDAVTKTVLSGFDETALQRFSEVTLPLIEKIEGNKREARTLAEIRDLLVRKLMSGEITPKDAEKKIEEAL